MKKKKNQSQRPQANSQKEDKLTLGDMLNAGILNQLKEKKSQLTAEEQAKKEQEELKRKEELKRREKNKTFEELLNESPMDWADYKK
jgi:Protein of unknown function (DUF3886)